MTEPHFDFYRIGIRQILEEIGRDHPSYTDALVLQQRLEENLNETKYGRSPALQTERARILDSCNRLSLSATGYPFSHFCGLPAAPSSPRERADEIFREATRRQIEGDLGYALQLYRQVERFDPDYPRLRATIAAVEREMGASYVDRFGHVREDAVPWPAPAPPLPAPMRRSARPARKPGISVMLMALVIIVLIVLCILAYMLLQGTFG